MFTKADILARLQNGDTVDTIAAEMAAALNEAEAEKKAMDAQKKEETRVLKAKRVAVNHMLDAVCDYLVIAGEGDLVDELKEVDTDKVIELLDGSIKMAKSLEQLKDLQFPFMELPKNPRVHKIVVDADADNADQVIGDFLKKLGL